MQMLATTAILLTLTCNMPIGDMLMGMMANSGLLQYPDKNLYNAAKLLAPEERPTVPVRLFTDPLPVYSEIHKQLGLAAPTKQGIGRPASAITTPDKKIIYVNQNSPDYKNLSQLATALAHEQVHVSRNDSEEFPAYQKGMEVIQRLGKQVPKDFASAYATQLRMRQNETK